MRRGASAAAAILMTMACIFTPALAGESMTPDRIEAALQRRISECRAWSGVPVYIEWSTRKTYVPDEQQLVALTREVADAPDHPDRDMIEAYIRRAAGNDPSWDRMVWFWSPSEFRFHTTMPGSGAEMIRSDVVRTQSTTWNLSGHQLSVLDPRSLPTSAIPESARRSFQHDIGEFLYPGVMYAVMTASKNDTIKLSVSVTGEDGWLAVSVPASKAGIEVTLTGVALPAEEDIRVLSVWISTQHLLTRPDIDSLPVKYEFYDYNTINFTNYTKAVPHKVRVLNYQQKEIEIRTINQAKSFERDEFDAVTKLPSAESPDRVYGWPDGLRVAHFDDQWRETNADGSAQNSRPLIPQNSHIDKASIQTSHSWYAYAVYFGLACGFMALVVIVLRKKFVS